MAIQLPPSLRRELHSIDEEVAWAKGLNPEERLAVVALLCRDSVTLLNMNPRRDRVLEARDAVPESTVAAYARLRDRR